MTEFHPLLRLGSDLRFCGPVRLSVSYPDQRLIRVADSGLDMAEACLAEGDVMGAAYWIGTVRDVLGRTGG